MRRLALVLVLAVGGFSQESPHALKPAAIAQANLGVSLAKEGKYREAVQAYQRAAAMDPTLPNLNLNIGLAWFKAGQFRPALAAFQKEPPNDRVNTLIAMSYFGMAQYKEAAARLKPLVEAQPDNTELTYVLAKCYLWSNDADAGMALFQKLLERDPDSAAVHMLMGEAQDAQNHPEEAIQEFELAARTRPGWRMCILDWGICIGKRSGMTRRSASLRRS